MVEVKNIHTLVLIKRVSKILLRPSALRMWPDPSHAAAIGRFKPGMNIGTQLKVTDIRQLSAGG